MVQRADASAERLRVGVIGTGFGKQHVRAFNAHPRATVTAVCSTDPSRAAAVAGELGVPHAFCDYRALLEHRSVDAVVVTAPPDRHFAIAAAALDAGKHVLCEKPLTTTLADARALVERARAAGVVHGVDQWLRFAPGSLWARELLAEGAIGRPLSAVDAIHPDVAGYFADPHASPNKHAWFARRERGGGFFLASAPHLLDRLLWCFGPARWVTGHTHTAFREVVLGDGRVVRCDAPDSFHALVGFASGVVASVQCAPTAAPGTSLRLEVHGDGGSLVLAGDPLGAGVKVAGKGQTAYTDLPTPDRLAGPAVPSGVLAPLFVLVDGFVRAVLDGEPASPSFEDGLRTQELIEGILTSCATGQRAELARGGVAAPPPQ